MMLSGNRPPLRSLQTFEATSRHMSISRAAQELGVTQSAVSHQLRLLSEKLGEKLLVKAGRSVALTDAGRRLATRLHSAFNQIDRSVADVVGVDRDVLRLAVCSSFAPGWLIGRLKSFYDDHPKFDLQLRMYARDPALTDEVADAFVTTFPSEAGFWALKLRAEKLIPVCAASAGRGRSRRLNLITTTIDPSRLGGDWLAYCETAGVPLGSLRTGSWRQVSHYILALDMARAGLGAALVPDFLAREDIAAGTLRQLLPQSLPTHEDYYLCVKASRRDEPGLRALVRWFRSQKST